MKGTQCFGQDPKLGGGDICKWSNDQRYSESGAALLE